MTVTYPSAGTPAARRAAARPFPATVRAAIAGVVAIGMLLVAGVPAHADATPSPTPTELSGEVALTLAPTDDGILAAGTPLSAWLILDNGTDRPLPERTATVSLGAAPIADRGSLSDWLSGDSDRSDLDELTTVTIPAAASGAQVGTTARVETNAAALQNRAPGVYPLVARAPGTAGSLTSRSVLIVPGTPDTAPVGIVVPVTAGPLRTGLLGSDELTELTAADGRLTAVLDAVSGTPAILAVDPAIPAAIRVLGTSAPDTATEWLDRLLRLPNERFALQFGDADVAAQLLAGASAPLQPATLAPYMDPADFAQTAPVPTPTPTATEAPAGPTLPDLATLTDIGGSRSDVYWPISGSANTDVAAVLGGVTSDGGQPSLTLVASATTDAGADDAAVPAAQRAGDAALLVYDSAASDALRDAAVVADTASRGAPLTAATAYLSLAAPASDPMLVVVDRANDYTRIGLRSAIAAVAQTPGTAPATLAELTGAAPGTVTIPDADTDAARVAAASQLSTGEVVLGPFSSILDDPAVLLDPERAEMLQLLGAGWASEPDLWASAMAAHREETAATLDAVGILPPSTTNLITSNAGLGFWVRNDLPWPVNVVLNANPDDVRLEVETATTVRVDAASNKRTEVPVQARVGNGEVAIALQLTSVSGVPIGAGQRVDVNVRADWEGVGVIILSVLVVGLLVLGFVRTVLHRRWLKRQADAADGSAPE